MCNYVFPFLPSLPMDPSAFSFSGFSHSISSSINNEAMYLLLTCTPVHVRRSDFLFLFIEGKFLRFLHWGTRFLCLVSFPSPHGGSLLSSPIVTDLFPHWDREPPPPHQHSSRLVPFGRGISVSSHHHDAVVGFSLPSLEVLKISLAR